MCMRECARSPRKLPGKDLLERTVAAVLGGRPASSKRGHHGRGPILLGASGSRVPTLPRSVAVSLPPGWRRDLPLPAPQPSLEGRWGGGRPARLGRPEESEGRGRVPGTAFTPAPPPRPHGFLPLAPRLSITPVPPTPQARLSCAYVGLDSWGLEELPLEPERRKEGKYQQQPRRLGRSARVPRLPARPRAQDGGLGPPAPPRARADAGLIYYSPRPELRLPGAEDPPD